MAGHEIDARIAAQLGAERVIRRRHHVDDAGRDLGFFGNDLGDQRGAPGRVRRGFENDGVAGREGRTEFGEIDLVRKVPRCDCADDADRFLEQSAMSRNPHR